MSKPDDSPGQVADMSDWHDLSAFQRDLLRAARALEDTSDPSSGISLKHDLEIRYGEELSNPRIYQNLDELVNRGLIEKEQVDGRTNNYALTEAGDRLMDARLREDIALRTPRLEDDELDTREEVRNVDFDDLDATLPAPERFVEVAERDDVQTIRGLAAEVGVSDPAIVRLVTHRLGLYDEELNRPEGRPDQPTAQEADD